MRNLKRALSLALASIMLLGMMVVGTSAASINDFTDADSVNNKEAVAIATGLGIFDGYDDGSFGPDRVVTRAEMAVVICKILHGSDVDPANFAGAGKFTDVPAWAEGYVNMCSSLGIIEGYGNGKFGPNDTVTTVQASTMLLKALGYFQKDTSGALGADWNLEVTSKATAIGLYGDMTLAMNAGLTRDNVAELTFNALFAQRVAFDDYRGLYVKNSDRNVVVTNGTVDPSNTLAQNTFGLYMVEGVVTANGMTDEALSESLKSKAQTNVMFTEDTDLNQDGKAEYTEGASYEFEVETGLDMIGHAAKVYYKLVKKTPVVFAITDQATKAEFINYSSNTTNLAKAANNAGFKKNTILDIDSDDYILNYDMDTTVKAATDAGDFARDLDTLLVISNSNNYQVDYVIALDQYLDKVASVDEDDDVIEYSLNTADGADMNVALADVNEGDYVIVTNIGNQDDVLVFQPAELMSADITKISGVSNATADVKKVYADGETYTASTVDANTTNMELVTAFAAIDTIGEATLILDQFGKLVGLAGEKSVPNYAYVAQYGVVHSTGSLNTKDVLTAHVYFADGTNGIYQVDKFTTLDGIDTDTDPDDVLTDPVNDLPVDFETAGLTALNSGNGQDNTAALGIWNVVVKSNGKIEITAAKTTEETTNGTAGAAAVGARLVKAHSTFVDSLGAAVTGKNSTGCNSRILYQNNDTVYFYVNGSYTADTLTVEVMTGIKNVVGFTNTASEGIAQVFATVGKTATARSTVGSVLVESIDTGSSNVYYYNEGNYHVSKASDGKYVLTFDLFDLNGKTVSVDYDGYATAAAAKADAEDLWDGFYLAKSDELVAYTADSAKYNNAGTLAPKTPATAVSDSDNTYVQAQKGNNWYIVNDDAKYDEYIDNLYTKWDNVGTIAEKPVIVDACNSGLDTVAKLVKAIKTAGDGNVKVAYTFNTDDYEADVIFVSYYDPKGTDAPGGGTTTNYESTGVVDRESDDPKSLNVTPTVATVDGSTMSAGTTLKVSYTVYLKDGSNWMKLGTYAGTDIVTTAAASTAGTKDVITSVTAAENATYKVEITAVGGSIYAEGVAYGMF